MEPQRNVTCSSVAYTTVIEINICRGDLPDIISANKQAEEPVCCRVHAMSAWAQGQHAKAIQALLPSGHSSAWLTLLALPLMTDVREHLTALDQPLSAPPPSLDALFALLTCKLDELNATASARAGQSTLNAHQCAPTPRLFGSDGDCGDPLACVAAFGALCRACKSFAACSDGRGALPDLHSTSVPAGNNQWNFFWPKYRLGHPENHLFLLSKKNVFRIKVSKKN